MRFFKGYEKSKRPTMAMIAFSNGYLSFEVEGAEVVAIGAEGNWQGHASIPAYCLALLHAAPPTENPVELRYENGKMRISTMSIGCHWEPVSAELIRRSESPDTLELLALDRTISRSEVHGTPLGRKIAQAKRVASTAITRAAKSLEPFGIVRVEIAAMVERQIAARIKKG